MNLDANEKKIIGFLKLFAELMKEKYGGETSFNTFLIMNYVFRRVSDGYTIYVTDAAQELSMSTSTVSRCLRGMEKDGLIINVDHDDDARYRHYRLADNYEAKAHETLDTLITWWREQDS